MDHQALSVLAVNVNGLQATRKRRGFFLQLLQGRWDVIVLTETHCPDDATAERWLQDGAGPGQPWQGPAHWCHGTSRSRGVAVLMRNSYACADIVVDFASADGRVLRVSWQPAQQGRRLVVFAVYAPHEPAARPCFFGPAWLLQLALQPPAEQRAADVFVAGDLNCVLRPEDVWGGAPRVGSRAVGAAELADMMAASGLQDVWGRLHGLDAAKAVDAYTYLSRDGSPGATAARLDYILAPAGLVNAGWVGSCSHRRDVQPSDHAAVELFWRAPQRTPKGRWRWIFPDQLLRDQEWLAEAVTAAAEFSDQWQPDSVGSPWAARDRYEAVKEFVVQLAAQRHAVLSCVTAALCSPGCSPGGASCPPGHATCLSCGSGWGLCAVVIGLVRTAARRRLRHCQQPGRCGTCGLVVGGSWGAGHQVLP